MARLSHRTPREGKGSLAFSVPAAQFLTMPELAAAYIAGFLANLLVAALFIVREWRIESGVRMHHLQRNLGRVGLWFANSQDALIDASAARPPSQVRTLVLLFAFCSFLSWPGLIFSIVISISLEKLAHREREKLFGSPLARGEDLPSGEVHAVLRDLGLRGEGLDK